MLPQHRPTGPSHHPASRPGSGPATSRLLDLGILAHIDAGKTSLTERLLFDTGATAALGRVDTGTTRTDSMELERRRGITIRAAVTAVRLGALDVSVIDTPGHTDFVAEVERALTVLDAAVLVLSAVEGVQPQTVTLWRSLRRIGIPTVLFINKVDRGAADPERVLEAIRERLTGDVVPLVTVHGAGSPAAEVRSRALSDPAVLEPVVTSDDGLLQRWADGRPIGTAEQLAALRAGIGRCALFPVLSGSAVTGAGVEQLRWAIEHLLPPAPVIGGPLAGTVFAVDRAGPTRRTWLRLWAGELHTRDRIGSTGSRLERVTHIAAATPAGEEERFRAAAGELVAITGLSTARIGDVIGTPPTRRAPSVAPPTLEAVVDPVHPADRVRMMEALRTLADEDPLIDLTVDGEIVGVRIHGEVQREVIGALLAERFGIPVRFSEGTVACIERVVGTGAAVERLKEDGNPYLATIGLEIAPLADSDEVLFSPGRERGRLPASFVAATEEGVRRALEQGPHGWPVRGAHVTMTGSHYWPRQSHAHQKFDKAMSSVGADFRNLAPVVVAQCLRVARTRVCEPIERFEAEVPAAQLGAVLQLFASTGSIVRSAMDRGRYRLLEGAVPSAQVGTVLRALPDLTGGEAVFSSRLEHYRPVWSDQPPEKARIGPDPADRPTWFRARPR